MMLDEKFGTWCLRNSIPEKAKNFISRIRGSQPSRAVGNSYRNVKGAYPSAKNGFTVQFESHTAELCGIYSYEYSDEVLEYYDQPEVIYVKYNTKNGKTGSFEYHPDFLVITDTKVYLDEWKTEDQLIRLTGEHPDRYCRDENGIWHFLPGEEFAKEIGIQFRLRSTGEINYVLYRNIQFLEDYLRYDTVAVPEETATLIENTVRNTPGITLSDLIEKLSPQATVDHIYILIATWRIFVNLETLLLVEPESALVFTDAETANAIKVFDTESAVTPFQELRPVNVRVGEVLIWDEVPLTIEFIGASSIILKGKDGKTHNLEKAFFDKFVRDGIITGLSSPMAASRDVAKEILLKASKKDLSEANRRYQIILHRLNGEKTSGIPDRTLRRYWESYRHAEKKYGVGYVGLLPGKSNPERKEIDSKKKQSNLPQRILDLFDEAADDYKSNKQQGKKSVYRKFCTKLEQEGLQKISFKSFRKLIRSTMTKHDETLPRKGERAAYQFEEIDWTKNIIPPHGDWPFHIAHIDHTLVDIEFVSSKTGKVLDRMWLTKMIDANTRRYLAITLSFDPPSYRSVMNVIRECVHRHGRLPHTIMTDNGKEFESIYFSSLLSYFGVIRKLRPPSSPRFGCVIERLIGTLNTTFIYNLMGNTQITKNVRQVTKAVNPKNLAIWTPYRFYRRLCEWAYEVYDTMDHQALGMSPRKAFEMGIAMSGHREHLLIPYDMNFIMMTYPSTPKGNAKLRPGLGVKINGIYYNCSQFKDPEIENTNVEVRYDPYDYGIAYAYVKGSWVQCRSQYYNVFKGKSERTVQFHTEELRKQSRLINQDFTLSAKKLAEFILSVEAEEAEALEIRRLREMENKAMLKLMDLPVPLIEEELGINADEKVLIDSDPRSNIMIYEEVTI